MKSGLNLIGPQVRKWRDKRSWTQEKLAQKLQLLGWSVSRHSLAKLELGLRRVPDCEVAFLAKALSVETNELFPKQISFKKVGPAFQSGKRLSVYPMRGEK